MLTSCYNCKFFKKVGLFNHNGCVAGTSDAVYVFTVGEISHISDVGCMSFELKSDEGD